MSREALRTQLDADYQRVLAENARLKDDRPDIAAGIEAEAEIAKLTTQIGDLQTENAALGSTAEAVEGRLQELMETAEDQRGEIAQLKSDLELLQAERDDLQQRNMKLEENIRTKSWTCFAPCKKSVDDGRPARNAFYSTSRVPRRPPRRYATEMTDV